MDTAKGRGMSVVEGKPAGVPRLDGVLRCVRAGGDIFGQYRHPNSPWLMDVRESAFDKPSTVTLNKAFLGGKKSRSCRTWYPTRDGWSTEANAGMKNMATTRQLPGRQAAEAGHGPNNPLKTNMLLSYQTGFPEGLDVQEAIIGYWKAVGVETKLITVDRAIDVAHRRGLRARQPLRRLRLSRTRWTAT